MKNKWTRAIVMIVVGFLAYGAGQNFEGVVADICTIVGAILMVGGFAEMFRKQKPTT